MMMMMILFPYYSLLAPSLHRSMSDFAKSLISFNPSYPSKNRLSSCFFLLRRHQRTRCLNLKTHMTRFFNKWQNPVKKNPGRSNSPYLVHTLRKQKKKPWEETMGSSTSLKIFWFKKPWGLLISSNQTSISQKAKFESERSKKKRRHDYYMFRERKERGWLL